MPPYVSAEIASWNERIAQAILSFGLATLGFCLLWSSAGTAISMFLIVVACCLAPRRFVQCWPRGEHMAQIGLLLLAWIALRTLLGEGTKNVHLRAVNHYHELLMLPVMWAVFRLAWRPQAFVNGLLLGALVSALVLFATNVHAWALIAGAPDLQATFEQAVTDRRISLGFSLSVCAFLLFEHTRLGRLPRVAGYGAAALLAATVLFAGDGRTGYVLLLVLLGCAGCRAAPRKWRYPAVVALLAAGMLVACMSTGVRSRTQETLSVLIQPASQRNTVLSTSIRIEMLRNAVDVAGSHWMLGSGWVGYADAFRAAALKRHPGKPDLLGAESTNPHSEYLLELGAGGLPALLLFLAWLGWPMWRGLRENSAEHPWAGAAGCVALAFATSALFNSVLLDFMEAHLYAALMAWLMARRMERS